MRALPVQSSGRNEVITYPRPHDGNKPPKNQFNFRRIPPKVFLIAGISIVIMGIIIAVIIVSLKKKKKVEEFPEGSLLKEGYFYPSDDKNKLYKCSLDNCQKCYGTIQNNQCYQCFGNSKPEYSHDNRIIKCNLKNPPTQLIISPTTETSSKNTNSITNSPTIPTLPEKLCYEGPNEQCQECDESKDECISCNPGYFLPSDLSSQTTCHQCTIKHCKQCIGTSYDQICSICQDYSEKSNNDCILKEGEGALCKNFDNKKNECSSCNIGYLLKDGICILNYDIKATFKTRTKNENVKLIDKYYVYIEEMIIDEKKLNKTVKTYTFEDKGEHTVYYKMKIPSSGSLIGMFEGLKKMTSVYFSERFELYDIKKMNRMFYNCENLKNIDLSNFNTKNVEIMNSMFYQCLQLDNINLSELESSKVNDASSMFENCVSLKNIDISNFNNSDINTDKMFEGIPDSGTITVNKNLKDKIELLLNNWIVITK